MAAGWDWLLRRWRKVGGPTYDEFYAGDDRRRLSNEIAYGSGWRDRSDRTATWALRWLEATGELCAMRQPGPDGVMFGGESAGPTRVTFSSSYTVEVLAVVETRATVEQVLAGWESHVNEADGLQWVRERLPVTPGGGRP